MVENHHDVYGYTNDVDLNMLLNKLIAEERRDILKLDAQQLQERIAQLSGGENAQNATDSVRLQVYEKLLEKKRYEHPRT